MTLLDAPGHQDFVPNMIAGTAQADAAILVVDGSHGGFEPGFRPQSASGTANGTTGSSSSSNAPVGQTREHVHVARSIGIKQLAVVITKLDTCEYSEDRFKEVQGTLAPFLATCGFKAPQWLPAAAPAGQNVSVVATDERLACWWPQGPTVVDAINAFEPVARPSSAFQTARALSCKRASVCVQLA